MQTAENLRDLRQTTRPCLKHTKTGAEIVSGHADKRKQEKKTKYTCQCGRVSCAHAPTYGTYRSARTYKQNNSQHTGLQYPTHSTSKPQLLTEHTNTCQKAQSNHASPQQITDLLQGCLLLFGHRLGRKHVLEKIADELHPRCNGCRLVSPIPGIESEGTTVRIHRSRKTPAESRREQQRKEHGHVLTHKTNRHAHKHSSDVHTTNKHTRKHTSTST